MNDFRDVNSLAGIYYEISAREFYQRLKKFEFSKQKKDNPNSYIYKYKKEYSKFFDILKKEKIEFSDFNYFLFLYHNNCGLYNEREVFVDENFFEKNTKFFEGIELYSHLTSEDHQEFVESDSIKNFKNNKLYFILKKIQFISFLNHDKIDEQISDFIHLFQLNDNSKYF